MADKIKNNRTVENEVGAIFTDRWSPRAFSTESLTQFQIKTLFEAAKWAPSCYNEQPWLFMYAVSDFDRKIFLSTLYEKNRVWANTAPLLIFAISRLNFTETKKKNRHALFDLGAAWLSLALQARRIGLFAHAMAGFHREKAYEKLEISSDEFDITVAIAVGYYGNKNDLPEDFKKIEFPNNRKSINTISFEGFPLPNIK